MTKIQIIRELISKNDLEIDKLNEVEKEIKSNRADELNQLFEKYFFDCLETGDSLRVGSESFDIRRPAERGEDSILTIYVKDSTYSYETGNADKLAVSFYTTSHTDEYELRRMVTIGKVGQIILDFEDDILAGYNQIMVEYDKQLKPNRKAKWDLDKKNRDLYFEIESIQKAELMNKLQGEGIEFQIEEDKYYKLPELDIRFDWSVRGIKKIKVLKKTASGKSADIELEVAYKAYNSEKNVYESVVKTDTYERVRVDKIERMLNYSKSLIVS
jgi:hypothetical protein